MVLRYLADAPLSTLTLNYRKAVLSAYRGEHVAEKSSLTSVDVERIVSQQFREAAIERSSADASLEALSACVNTLVARIDHDHGEFTARVATLSSQLDSVKTEVAPRYVSNAKYGKFHVIRCSDGFDARRWRTSCGISFGARPDLFAVRKTCDDCELKCFNCFGAM